MSYIRSRRARIRSSRKNKRGVDLFILVASAVILFMLLILSAPGISGCLLTFASPALSEKSNVGTEQSSETRITLKPKEAQANTDTKASLPLSIGGSDSPTILIYHTHALEAYTPTEKYPYNERGGTWRTADNTRNVVAVGELLAQELRSYGFNVIHDTTNHEPPKLSTAYERSLETMEKYKKSYPTIEMFIDLHRDAAGSKSTGDYCVIDGEKTARIMFVVGTGKGATGTGYNEMPDFESNYALACALTDYLRGIDSGLVREIRVKKGRYNQHMSSHCILAEIGHNMNTLEEALSAVKHLAKAIAHEAGAV